MVSWRPTARATFNFVPTPSTLDTRTGAFIPLKSARKSPQSADLYRAPPVHGLRGQSIDAALEGVPEVDVDASLSVCLYRAPS